MAQQKRNTHMTFRMVRLFGFAGRYWPQWVGILMASVLTSVLWLQYPVLLGQFIDAVIIGRQFSALPSLAWFLCGFIAVQAVLTFWRGYTSILLAERVAIDLRIHLYRHLQRISLQFFQWHSIGDVLSRLTNDVLLVREAITSTLMNFVSNLFLLLAGGVALCLGPGLLLSQLDQFHIALPNSPPFSIWNPTTLWLLVFLLLLTLPNVLAGVILRPLMRRQQETVGEGTAMLEEAMSNQSLVKAFSREEDECHRYERQSGRQMTFVKKRAWVMSAANVFSLVLTYGGIACVLLLVGNAILSGGLTIGDLTMTLILLLLLSQPLTSASSLYSQFQMALGAAERLCEILDAPPDIHEGPAMQPLPRIRGHICFSQVSFSYDGQTPALKNLSFDIEPGQVVALVGPSGAGKTTIVSLLLRFFAPQSGAIVIDGHDITQRQVESVRRQIGVVLQEPILFNTTIRENIAYGKPDASLEEIQAIARVANAHEFIERLPQGYETLVGERGAKFSVGQRQRIAIARALLRNPRLLILDEATSSLDSENERLVQEALERLMKRCTTLIIAHRLSTIHHADKILVLEQGRVVEQGTHASLLARGGLYKQLYATALQGSETNATLR